jgi:hypothetical protein
MDVVAFVNANAPDVFQGEPVGFGQFFLSTVTQQDAFPDGGGNSALLPLLNVEIWGVPISRPFPDPNNPLFVFQRFQRGIFMYDHSTGRTEPLLLGDYFKSILTGYNLPPDLDQQATGSPYYRQYNPELPTSLERPFELPGSDLTGAFDVDDPASFGPPKQETEEPFVDPDATTESEEALADPDEDSATPQPVTTPIVEGTSTCNGDELITFIPTSPKVGDEVLIAATSAKLHVFTQLFGTEKTTKVREEARPGQRGWVWTWTVTPTIPGPHQYIFYIDDTVPCQSIAFSVGSAFQTAEPTPTAEPTATRTPSNTKTPTPKPVDEGRSRVNVSKSTIDGDGFDSAEITVLIRDDDGNPVDGVDVSIELDPNSPRPDNFVDLENDTETTTSGEASFFVTADYCDFKLIEGDPEDPDDDTFVENPDDVITYLVSFQGRSGGDNDNDSGGEGELFETVDIRVRGSDDADSCEF